MSLFKCLVKTPLLLMCSLSFFTYADESLPDVTMNISLKVVEVTCQINNGQGFNKIVDFGVIDAGALSAGTNSQEKVEFLVDCSSSSFGPDSIAISINSGSQGVINDGADGLLKTSLNGVGIKLKWLDGTDMSLNGTPKSFNQSSNLFNFIFYAKPVAVNSSFDKGIFKSSIIINALYI